MSLGHDGLEEMRADGRISGRVAELGTVTNEEVCLGAGLGLLEARPRRGSS
jgi:hypothetical protein